MSLEQLRRKGKTYTIAPSVQRWLSAVWVVLVATVGALVQLFATRWGIGLSPDSADYVTYARKLAHSQGMRPLFDAPVTQWPPLYPILVSGSGLFGSDPLAGARIIHALLFGGNVLLVGYLLYRYSGRLRLAGVGTLLFATSGTMLLIHFFAWSEPLFIFMMLLGMLVLEHYLKSGRRLYLLGAALFIGLACLTRYVGVTLVGTAVLGILFFRRTSLRQKVIELFVFSLFSTLPLALWFLHNLSRAGSTSGRAIAFHPVSRDHFWHALFTFSSWLHIANVTPGFVWVGVWGAILVATVAILWLRSRKEHSASSESKPIPTMLKLQALFIVSYALFLIFSISFVDANTPLDDRILSPIFVSALILALFFAGEMIRLAGDRYRVTGAVLVGVPLLLLAAANLAHGATWVTASRAQGLGYSSPRWQQSPLVAEVQSLPADTVIFSNAPEVIELFAERPATPLPRRIEAMTQAENADYDEQVAAMAKTVESGEGVIVFFSALDRPVITAEELHRRLSLQPLAQVEDGAILGADNRK